ncbi:MAG: hypothetical protein QMD95_04235 [Candidatus Hodarchaeaceae archaeon]|nr:hypothetical protein [Candidatus Hodarchaeaceae archaeon]
MKRNILIGIPFIIAFLIGSCMVLGPLKGKIPSLLGVNPSVHIMIILTISLYLYFSLTKPKVAEKSARDSLGALGNLAVYIVAALFIAGAVINLLPSKTIAAFLGEQAGLMAVLVGVGIGCILPACPFITYPIVMGVYAAGAGLPGVMGMLFGSGTAFACVLSCDLTYFNSKIMGLRLLLTISAALVAGFLAYLTLTVLG